MDTTNGRVRVRAGGRSEKVRQAVGEATLGFLEEGRLTFSVVDVAARAGVGRRTVYRWWPTRHDLLVEALQTHVRRAPVVEAVGSWEENLRALAHRLAEFAEGPVESAIAAIMAGGQHPEFNQTVLDQWRPAIESWHRLVHVGAERGEVAEGLDPRTMIDTLLVPIVFTPLAMRRPMDTSEVDALVDLLLTGARAR